MYNIRVDIVRESDYYIRYVLQLSETRKAGLIVERERTAAREEASRLNDVVSDVAVRHVMSRSVHYAIVLRSFVFPSD